MLGKKRPFISGACECSLPYPVSSTCSSYYHQLLSFLQSWCARRPFNVLTTVLRCRVSLVKSGSTYFVSLLQISVSPHATYFPHKCFTFRAGRARGYQLATFTSSSSFLSSQQGIESPRFCPEEDPNSHSLQHPCSTSGILWFSTENPF